MYFSEKYFKLHLSILDLGPVHNTAFSFKNGDLLLKFTCSTNEKRNYELVVLLKFTTVTLIA